MKFVTKPKRAKELYNLWCDAIGWTATSDATKWNQNFLPKIEYRAKYWDHPNEDCEYALSFGVPEMSSDIVQFNLYSSPNPSRNGTGFAIDGSAKWLLRKATLKGNPFSKAIKSEHFRKYSNVEFVTLSNSTIDIYAKVANLAATRDEIAADTAYFLEQCRALRERFAKAIDRKTGHSQANHGPDERSTKGYEVPPSTKDVLHTKISKALEKWVNNNNGAFELPNTNGWNHDGIDKKNRILYEIKSKSDANSVQTATGQLFLYEELFRNINNYQKTLVVPSEPAQKISKALKNIGISVIIAKPYKNGYKFETLK